MTVTAFLFVDKDLKVAEMDFSYKDENEFIISSVIEAAKEINGELIYVTIKTKKEWLFLKRARLEAMSSSLTTNKALNEAFSELKNSIGISDAKKYLIDLIDEENDKFDNYLKELKIK